MLFRLQVDASTPAVGVEMLQLLLHVHNIKNAKHMSSHNYDCTAVVLPVGSGLALAPRHPSQRIIPLSLPHPPFR